VWRVAACIAAIVELGRIDAPPRWVSRLSMLVLFSGIAAFALLRWSIGSYRIPSSSMYPTIQIGDFVMVDELSIHWRAPERGEVVFFAYPCAREITYVKRVIAIGGDTVEVRCNVVYVNGQALESELVAPSRTYDDFDPARGEWYSRSVSVYREHHGGHTYDVFQEALTVNGDGSSNRDAHDFPQPDRMLVPSCGQSEFYDVKPSEKRPVGTLVVTKQAPNSCEPQAHFVVPPGTLFVMGDNRMTANDSRVWGVVPVDAVSGRAMGIWLSHPPGRDRSFSRIGTIR
jgi:signal peptidase I